MSTTHEPSNIPRFAIGDFIRRWSWLCLVLVGCLGWWIVRRAHFDSAVSVPSIDVSKASRELSAAIFAARTKVEQNPRSGAAWGELGMWLMAHQFEHEANICLEQAKHWDSQDPRWSYLLGLSLSVSQRDRAILEFRHALSLRNQWAVAHSRLGELLLAREDLDDAQRELQIAFEQDPNDPRAPFNLSRLCLMRADHSTALFWGRKATRLAPDVRTIHELLAEIHQRQGNREAALVELQIAEQAPIESLGWTDELAASVLALRRDAGRQLELAEALLHAGRHNEAIRVLSAALREDDRDLRMTVLLAQTLNQLQRGGEAKLLLETAETRHPESAELRFQRGVALFQAAQFVAAEQSFRGALQLKPDHALAHYNLGHTLLMQNLVDDAESAFEASAQFRPQFVPAHLNAARLQIQRGAIDNAQKHLRTASLLSPDDPEVRQLLREASKR